MKLEIGINILTHHLQDLSGSQPCLISWHWPSDLLLCNLHTFHTGLVTSPNGGGSSRSLCCSKGRRARLGGVSQLSQVCRRLSPTLALRGTRLFSRLFNCSPHCTGFYFVPLCFGGYGLDPRLARSNLCSRNNEPHHNTILMRFQQSLQARCFPGTS